MDEVAQKRVVIAAIAQIQEPTILFRTAKLFPSTSRFLPIHIPMDLPSTRELELETLLREKDAQLAEVAVCSTLVSIAYPHRSTAFPQEEITALRQYLSKQPGPSTTDAVTLPPALLSVLLPHINSAAGSTATTSSTVTAALSQRARLLQEENDELYELLKSSETGKLTDEVRGLRRTVAKLQGALEGFFHLGCVMRLC